MRNKLNKKVAFGLTLAVLVALILAPLALADVLHGDDLNAGGNTTKTPGQTGTASYYLTANGPDGCNATTTNNVTVSIFSDQSWLTIDSPGTISLSGCDNTNNGTIGYTVSSTAPVGGVATVSGVASGGTPGNNGYNNTPGSFTVTVVAPPPPSDTTPPAISYVFNPASPDGANGWYVSDVTLTWTVSENESPSSLVITGCVDQNITADQLETSYSCSATSDGGSAGPVNVSIKRDATAPSVSLVGGPADQAETTYSCSATSDGGSAGPVSVSIKRDATAPSVSLVGGPADGASYYFGSVPAEPTCSASDALSGLASACSVSGYGTTVGSHTVTASATDNAGNSNSASATYTVLKWTLNGFYSPVDMGGVYNTVKGGATVPLKFEVFAGSTELTATSVVYSFVQTRINCDGTMPTDEIEVTSTGGTSLRYDTTAGQFVQNWQTPKQAGACYRVTMTTQDGSPLVAYFKLK